MKAALCRRYGPPEVFEIGAIATPEPGPREVQVRVCAAAVSVSDTYIRSAVPFAGLVARTLLRLFLGVTRPRRPILGAALAGEVTAVGRKVTRFAIGERVVAFTMLRMGAYAEFACVAENGLIATLPPDVDFPSAAAVPYGGLLASYFLRKAGLKTDEEVLIYGASGAIGSAALQIAVHAGARVTAVCGPDNLDLVRALGAVATLDYTTTDSPGAARYDLVFDAVGKRRTSALKSACEKALKHGGRATSVDSGMPRMTPADLVALVALAERGALKPVIDRSYPLERIAEAHAYVETRHKRGNVIVVP